ncbi:hypothetical protein GCM10010978_02430 [Compostibacillus humi]|uniref:Uncharacterized protein n=1 Tax=Compostibacillus humi TaxID=1245525 RepID=A0A8J2ZNV9_9BACI|nr:YpdA family putative bacillithiol disulfide reductase [Compostibacillus humi]GGH68940.1 hypothetical protein GCM10010978_02430 [Compostibacillus humi]HLT56790.1 YpdA family putative bacillithiol disulfide reductase [Bacillota bacterium]
MNREQVIIIGAGPCGLSCALELEKLGIRALIIEKGNIVNSLYRFPTHQTFFSTSERLEIGDVPFITEKPKPVRLQALAYYREVCLRNKLRIHTFEKAEQIEKTNEGFLVRTTTKNKEVQTYYADFVVIATGYYDQPNYLNIPGENLEKVTHYFKEAHPYYDTDVAVIGGKNSAVDAALELFHAGARVTVLYRGKEYSKSIKPWILPEFDSLIRKGKIEMIFESEVVEITNEEIHFTIKGRLQKRKNDFVFAMTGYRPDIEFLKMAGVNVDPHTGKPDFDEETMETNVPGIYIAGVVAAGFNNNEIFIENGRFHGKQIAQSVKEKTE